MFPTDDLLRDVISYQYGYDYRNLYIHSPLMTQYNQYIAFDRVLGLFREYNITNIIIGIKYFMLIMFAIPVWLIVTKLVNQSHNDVPAKSKINYTLFYSTLIMVFLAVPINGSRPQILFCIWSLYGYLIYLNLDKKHIAISQILWLIVGVALIPFYWLHLFYVPAILFAFRRNWVRALTLIVYVGLNYAFWQNYSHGLWLESFHLTTQQIANRIPSTIVAENLPPYGFLFFTLANVTNVFNLFLLYYTINKLVKEKIKPTLSGIWKALNNSPELLFVLIYMATNMNKYLLVMYPVLIFSYIKYVKIPPFGIEQPQQVLMMLVTLLLAFNLMMFGQPDGNPIALREHTNIPAGSKVLTTFDGVSFFLPVINKDKIQVFPSMEFGAGEKQYQQISYNIGEGQYIDCKVLEKSDFDYIATKILHYGITETPCLKLIEQSPTILVFKIVR